MTWVGRALLVAALVATSLIAIARPSANAATTPAPALYVVNTGTPTLVRANPTTAAPTSVAPVGTDPSAVAITPDGRRAYVANKGGDSVTPVDLTVNPPLPGPSITVGTRPVAMAITPDGGKLYVVNNGSGTVTPISIATNVAEPPIPVGLDPRSIALNPDGTKAYVAVGTVDLVWINLLDRRVAPPERVGADPRGIAITPNGVVTYVVSRGENKLYLLYEDKVVKTLTVGAQPDRVAINSDGTHLYVTSSSTSTITDVPLIANGDVSGVTYTITLPSAPTDVTFSPDGATAFVASAVGNSVTPITVATRAVGTPATGYSSPVALVDSPDQPGNAQMSVSSLTAVGCTVPAPPGATSQVCLTNTGNVEFDASATTPSTTPVVSYRWNFGDGTDPTSTAVPTNNHTYTTAGNYLPTVTAITRDGTGATRAFTGQTMSRNGGPAATAMASVRVTAGVAVNADSPLVYVTNFDSLGNGQITPILSPTGGPASKMTPFPAGRLPVFPAVAPSGRAVVYPDKTSGAVAVTAVCTSGSGVSFVPGDSQPVGADPNRVAIAPLPTSTTTLQEVYAVLVTSPSTPALRRFDLTITSTPCGASLSAPLGTAIPLGAPPGAVAITPDGKTAYVALPSLNSVVPVDLANGMPGTPIVVGTSPESLAITPDGFVVLVANSGSNNVSAIYKNQVVDTIEVGAAPKDIAISADGKKAFVANSGTTTVTQININVGVEPPFQKDPTPISLGTGVYPTSLAVAPDAKTLWVTSYITNRVLPVTIATKSVGATLTGFVAPIGVVAAPDQGPLAGLALTATTLVPCGAPIPEGAAAQACLDLGGAVTFNAGPSAGRSSPIDTYTWDFGDGSPLLTTTTPTTPHTYQNPGTYITSLTVTDAAGTSLTQAFTGQTMSRNGSLRARAYGLIRVIAPPTPTNTPLIYLANGSGDSITPIAVPTSGPVAVGNAFAAGRLPVYPAVTPDGRAVVTPNKTSGEVSVNAVCPNTPTSSLSYKYGNSLASGIDPNWVAISPVAVATTPTTKSWAVFVANNGGSEVRQFLLTVNTGMALCDAILTTPISNTVIPVGPKPYGIVITPDGKTAYVTVSGTNSVVPIDVLTGTPGRPIPVGSDPRGLALSGVGGTKLYVTNFGSGTVTPISIGMMGPTVGGSIAVGPQPLAIAVNPAGTLAFVTNSGATTIAPIDVTNDSTLPVIDIGAIPTSVAFTLDGSKAFVTSYLGNSVIQVNPTTGFVFPPIRGVLGPTGIFASPGVS